MNFQYYNHLGFHNPYFVLHNEEINLFENFKEGLENLPQKELDISSVIEILNRGYIFGDKTIVKSLQKTPWMAKPDSKNKNWEFFDLPVHQENFVENEEIADTLFSLLKKEISDYVAPYNSVGILLTGGMDSRIVACALKIIQDERPITVKAFTWGYPNSRDVLYAERISKLYNWDWENLTVDSVQMSENLKSTIENGSEYSPIHLHAMLQLVGRNDVDCYLAGSFGDSIGRAEYSGTKVENLSSHLPLNNRFGLIRNSLLSESYADSKNEIEKYHNIFPQEKPYQQYEQDYQLHYMRKMLNSCMSLIDNKTPLFQAFSSPDVFGFMWSLAPQVRNNNVYKSILKKYGHELLEIPWARTGLVYPETKGTPDGYKKSNHDYGKLIREEILPSYKDLLFSDKMEDLKIFNTKVLKQLFNLCTRRPIRNNNNYESQLLWIISLILTCEKYNIKSYSQAKESIDKKAYLKGLIKYNAKYYKNKS